MAYPEPGKQLNRQLHLCLGPSLTFTYPGFEDVAHMGGGCCCLALVHGMAFEEQSKETNPSN